MDTEIERLVADLEKDVGLAREASAHGANLEALAGWASRLGYDFTLAELSAFLESSPAELGEDELERVTGGTGLQSLGLQTTTDRRTGIANTLSNILSTVSDTQDGIVPNIK